MVEDSTQTPRPVRRPMLYRAALEVLADESPLPRAEVLARVGVRLVGQFSEHEASQWRPDNSTTRWQNFLAWGSTDMVAAGYLTKSPQGWYITDAGRSALALDADGALILAECDRAYRARPKARSTSAYVPIVEAALDLIEPGQWTTYSDLATVASTNAQTVGSMMGTAAHPAAFRVLSKSGRPSPDFRWSDPFRTESQTEALIADGVRFDATGAADEEQHVRAEDLRAYLENLGVLAELLQRAWLIRGSAVDGHDLVPDWLKHGYASLRASKLREVEPGISREELKEIVAADYSQAAYSAKAAKLDEFHAFLSRMRPDDLVVTTSQGKLYVGVLAGDAFYDRDGVSPANLRHRVGWSQVGHDYADLSGAIKSRLSIQYDVVEMTQQLDALTALLAASPAVDDRVNEPPLAKLSLALPDATDELATRLHVDWAWLQECIELLRDRPQLIFYGPPGTGKTYLAQAIAEHLAGDNVRLVQFHPAYSYEDFFEGYRPTEEGGFALRPGPLRKTVDAARENPATSYFVIIDEINRGNLAKIFGELYFLLEYRDRNIDLLYATGDDIGFSLPENVFIIGTMNTADRSIALVDAAMRRRFAFLPLHPNEAPTNDVLRRWLAASGLDAHVADLLDALNQRIEDDDFKIGPSYLMRKAVHGPGGLDRAWRTAILPLLEEHHYGDGVDVATRYGLAVIEAAVAAAMSKTTSNDATDPA